MKELKSVLIGFVRQRIERIAGSKAALATLRRGIGKKPGDIPELLGYVLPTYAMTTNRDLETMVEQAIYTALTLYAFHQQGSNECMSDVSNAENEYQYSFGHAMRKLVNCDKDRETAITRRFNVILTAKDITGLSIHLRSLIGLLKSNGIKLDYGRFAADLFEFQQDDYRRNVILQWGKDYYMTGKDD
jgi:CRISPR system Cascade subunit CasB